MFPSPAAHLEEARLSCFLFRSSSCMQRDEWNHRKEAMIDMQGGLGCNWVCVNECHPFSCSGELCRMERCSRTPEWTFQLKEHLNLALLRRVMHTTDCQNSHKKLSLTVETVDCPNNFQLKKKKIYCFSPLTNITELISVSPCF